MLHTNHPWVGKLLLLLLGEVVLFLISGILGVYGITPEWTVGWLFGDPGLAWLHQAPEVVTSNWVRLVIGTVGVVGISLSIFLAIRSTAHPLYVGTYKAKLRKLYKEGLNIYDQIKGKNPAYRQQHPNDPPHAFRPSIKERIDKWCERVETLLRKAKNPDALSGFKKQKITNASEFAVRLATVKLILSRDYGVEVQGFGPSSSNQTPNSKLSSQVQRTYSPDMEMRDAVLLVAGAPSNDSAYDNFDIIQESLAIIRQLAFYGYITIWGKRITSQDGSSYVDAWTRIPKGYWGGKELHVTVLDGPESGAHTISDEAATNEIDDKPDYTATRVKRSQIEYIPLSEAARIIYDKTRDTTLAGLAYINSHKATSARLDPIWCYANELQHQDNFPLYGCLAPSVNVKEVPSEKRKGLCLLDDFSLAGTWDGYPKYTNLAIQTKDLQTRIKFIEETYSTVK